MDKKSTGRVVVGAGAASISVYLMQGNVIAAESPDDARMYAHLLRRQGAIDDAQADKLDAAIDASEYVFGSIMDAAGASLDALLEQRFLENLSAFTGSLGKPDFKPMSGVFVDNIQMGHNTSTLLDQCCLTWDRANTLDLDAMIEVGRTPFAKSAHVVVGQVMGNAPRTISSVLLDVPFEALASRILLLDMLAANILNYAAPAENDLAPREDDFEQSDGDDFEQGDDDDFEQSDDDDFELNSDDAIEQPEPIEQNAKDADVVATSPVDDFEQGDEDTYEQEIVEDEDDEDVDDAPTEMVQTPLQLDQPPAPKILSSIPPAATPAPADEKSSFPTSLNSWMAQSAFVDDDELDFFADHDFDRGEGDEGAFSTETHNLEKVELFGAEEEKPTAPVVAPKPSYGDGPTTRFSAPKLTDEDANAKIKVANDELAKVVRAFDEAEGAGRGRAVVQLLVDGCPSKFAALLHDLQVGEDGTLPAEQVIHNLSARPATEHRQLMNQALIDVIDRALSSAADELPDEVFDDMYEAIAGYRQRMGL